MVAALAAEARALGRATPAQDGLARLHDGTLVAVSGMGCTAAARGAVRLVDAGARALVSFGLAGALDPALPPGAIIVADTVLLEGGGRSLSAAQRWGERVRESLVALGVGPLERGRLLTSPRLLAAAADKADAFQRTRAAAVDMESFAIAEVAEVHGLPFLAVRVVVDRAADELPRALEEVTDSSGVLSLGRLLGRVLCAPSSLRPVLRLGRRYRAARRSLRRIARAGALAGPDR